jgi:hypothetical protein
VCYDQFQSGQVTSEWSAKDRSRVMLSDTFTQARIVPAITSITSLLLHSYTDTVNHCGLTNMHPIGMLHVTFRNL